MSLPKLTADVEVIQGLDVRPNAVGGLSAAELQAKFDEAPTAIKNYLNDDLVPALDVSEEDLAAITAGAVRHDTAQSLTDANKTQARTNIGAVSQSDADARYVRYNGSQSLTDSQKAVARSNIGAMTSAEHVVLYRSQSLTDAQKAQARTNIGAIASGDAPVRSVAGRTGAVYLNAEDAAYQSNSPIYGTQPADVDDALKGLETAAAGAVRHDTAQSLTDAQKAQARANIGAAEAEDDPTFAGVTTQLLTLEDSGDEVGVSVSAANRLGFTGTNDHAVRLGNIDTPTDAYDAANKGYVDDFVEDNALMATKTQVFQASEKACARTNIGAEAARTDLSAAFAAQSDQIQVFLAKQAAGRYVVTVSDKVAFADNDAPASGVVVSRITLVKADQVARYVAVTSGGSTVMKETNAADLTNGGTVVANSVLFHLPVTVDSAYGSLTVPTPTASGHAATKGYVDSHAELPRTDLSAAFAAQSDYATPQNFLAQQAAGRYVVDWMYNGSKIATCYADNDQPGGSGGVLLSRSTLVAYDGTVFRYVCCKSAYGSSDTTIYEQVGVSSSGTEFSKPVTVPTPTASGHAATKGYVDGRTAALPGSDGYYLLRRSSGAFSYEAVSAWNGGSY